MLDSLNLSQFGALHCKHAISLETLLSFSLSPLYACIGPFLDVTLQICGNKTEFTCQYLWNNQTSCDRMLVSLKILLKKIFRKKIEWDMMGWSYLKIAMSIFMSKMLATSRKIVINTGGIQPPGTQFVPEYSGVYGVTTQVAVILKVEYSTLRRHREEHQIGQISILRRDSPSLPRTT